VFQDVGIQPSVHYTIENAYSCSPLHADPSPHIHLCWMLGPVSVCVYIYIYI